MSHILSYDLFEAQREPRLTPDQTLWLDWGVGEASTSGGGSGSWTLNPRTGLVDVDGGFNACHDRLQNLQGVRFGHVSGDFTLQVNDLTSLAGAPREVGGNFDCEANQLTSLAGAPRKVRGDFYCLSNQLASLEGAPREVGGDFNCKWNKLTSLAGAPRKVRGDFDCRDNKLTSLEGAPREVGGGFYCPDNKLTSLTGAPAKVSGNFDCRNNKLTSLAGAPAEVSGNFDCRDNKLTSLQGAPRKVDKDFNCDAFWINDCARHWHLETWLKLLKGEKSKHYTIKNEELTRILVLPLVPTDALVGFFRDNPLELDLLDRFPKLKQQVLELTGLPDTSGVSKSFRSGLI